VTAAPKPVDAPAPPIAPEGVPIVLAFVVGSAAITSLSWWLGGTLGGIIAGSLCAALTAWCVWFFRDPRRTLPADPSAIVSPADGVVVAIGPALPPPETSLAPDVTAGMTRVSIFMNVFNVHVNRSPIAATIAAIHYKPGKFFNASLDKASEHNERCSLTLRLADGATMVVTQIAGLIARRIVCRVKDGRSLATGERFGLIRFGSRVDVYLPAGITPLVAIGQRSVAGETILATLAPAAANPARPGQPLAESSR
jgi:phosphatidylserine decarboxylase